MSKALKFFDHLPRIKRPEFSNLRRIRPAWGQLLEITLIIIWALWVGRAFLNFDPMAFPRGGDFPLQIQGTYMWKELPQCGICVLWNGYMNGGSPAFAEMQGAELHPIVALGTLLWGAINGAKFMLLCSLIIAGLAQWWLAKVMGLGWLARLWSGIIIIVCQHLGGNLQDGLSTMVFAVANASLIFPPAVDLALNHNRKAIVWLGLAIALTILSGQGYVQFGFIFAILPAFLILMIDFNHPKLWKDFALAGILGLLLPAFFLIPLLHFYPYFAPEGGLLGDTIQSLSTVFLSFVSTKEIGPGYSLFVGWVPVILALVALRKIPKEKIRLLSFFIVTILLILALSTQELMAFLSKYIPLFGYFRLPSLISPLAVPLVIGLAAWGVDLLIKATWPKISLYFSSGRSFSASTVWLVIIPLILAIQVAYPVGRQWMYLDQVQRPTEVIPALQTTSTEWVAFPVPDYIWEPVILAGSNLKLTNAWHPWHWKNRDLPVPYEEVFLQRDNIPDNSGKVLLATIGDFDVVKYPPVEYASVTTATGNTACQANALGGSISVTCDTPSAGLLTVEENSFSGWYVWVDGKPASLDLGKWLAVAAPAGKHTYQFRYLPFDVLLGVLLSIAGIILAVMLLTGRWPKRKAQPSSE